MLILTIDSATPSLVVGLVDTDARRVLAETTVHACRHHNERLVPAIGEALAAIAAAPADLAGVVAGCGPGPFTGLRVGMATAQAYADALDIPVWPVCTLDAMAASAVGQCVAGTSSLGDLLVVTDARRREWYYATYRDGQRITEPNVGRPDAIIEQYAGQVGLVAAAAGLTDAAVEAFATSTVVETYPTPIALASVANLAEPPEPLVALYLRRPDAKEPARKPRSSALPPRSDT
ncbi:tRNA (adenosine(37)-N6)-threonylcarbamoyltransferase complex dimerization subunit type 1 TsaB [Corynebacterium choanae]|uniref:tRNA threonylcarbamoyladenosine biosynthesis protein TsaB n=1 Tax=Corynebacterium choanae TaxID=1862358 RepID=A0A3G6JC61_9CORY|nr:tRNA (adenosine(37)-N6)-threonylcarbamoyltransferase complex dimerization subunit type 1 TsaB [Corynebacterium choanae]AZA14260.1 tRNA threonylcarbamoyladenosine biosynthesis protein TsaB [Corynebacterium choanae]